MTQKPRSQPIIQGKFVSRPATMADLEELVDLYNDYWEATAGVRKMTMENARTLCTTPGFDLERSTRVVLTPAGRIVGLALVVDLGTPPVHPEVAGAVHPDFEGRGVGAALLQWAEERAREAIARVPEGLRVSMYASSTVAHEPTRRLFEKMGLQAVRHSWLMAIDLDGPPPEPEWPEGIVIRTYQDHPDLGAVYRAVSDAFKDHWGYVQQPEEEGLRRWQHRIESDSEFDPSLWFLAMDGDEIAGMSLCPPHAPHDHEMGFVNTLGVRRPWRRKGLALTLLYLSFGEFYRRGKKKVGLGVDAGSLTGATRLYEKAGMYVEQQITLYEKELRPGQELGTQVAEQTALSEEGI